MKNRNPILELARFVFAILVVGYHVQMGRDGLHLFANGAVAVEFFFVVAGFFFARSVENIVANQKKIRFAKETMLFMKKKVASVLPVHLTAILAMFFVLILDSNFGSKFVQGLPSVFLVQMAAVWNDGYANAWIVPEWFLSAMLLCMLFMYPLALALRKSLKGPFVPLILLALLLLVLPIGAGIKWQFPQNFVYDLRCWAELCLGMYAYYLAKLFAKRDYDKRASIALKVAECVGYGVPALLGFLPIPATAQPYLMGITVVFVLVAMSITFAGKGVEIDKPKAKDVMGYLGALSLPMYLFHPVLISAIGYTYPEMPLAAQMVVVIVLTVAFAGLYHALTNSIRKARQQDPKDVAIEPMEA